MNTKNKVNHNIEKHEAIFNNEQLDLCSTIYLDQQLNIFLEKKILLTIAIITDKGTKIAGQVKYNLSQLINDKKTEKLEILQLEKCPDTKARLIVQFKASMISEIGDLESLSQVSSISPPTSIASTNIEEMISDQKNSIDTIYKEKTLQQSNEDIKKQQQKLNQFSFQAKPPALQNTQEKANFKRKKSNSNQGEMQSIPELHENELQKEVLQQKQENKQVIIEDPNNQKLNTGNQLNDIKQQQYIQKLEKELAAEKDKTNELFKRIEDNKFKVDKYSELQRNQIVDQQKLKTQEVWINNLSKDLEQSKATIKTQQQELEKLKQEQQSEQITQQLQEENKQLNSIIALQKEQMIQMKNQLEQNEIKFIEMHKQFKEKLNEKEKNIETLIKENAKIVEFDKVISQLQKENSALKEKSKNDQKSILNENQQFKASILASNEKKQKDDEQYFKTQQLLQQDNERLKGIVAQLEQKLQKCNKIQNDSQTMEELTQENDALKQDYQEIQDKFNTMKSQYNKDKIQWQTKSTENENLSAQVKLLSQQYQQLQKELVISKQRLGDAINLAFEYGGQNLVEKITSSMDIY